MKIINKYIKEGFTAVTALGTVYFYTITIIFLFLLGITTKALHLIIGLAICYIFVLILRTFYYRERPIKEDYFNFFTKLNASSFPSLHTLTFTYTATVLSTILNITKITIFLIFQYFALL